MCVCVFDLCCGTMNIGIVLDAYHLGWDNPDPSCTHSCLESLLHRQPYTTLLFIQITGILEFRCHSVWPFCHISSKLHSMQSWSVFHLTPLWIWFSWADTRLPRGLSNHFLRRRILLLHTLKFFNAGLYQLSLCCIDGDCTFDSLSPSPK